MMKLPVFVAIAAGALFAAVPAQADTVNARCEYYPNGASRPQVAMGCTFSQRQGVVSIRWNDGVSNVFKPVGDRPGNYVDQRGGRVYRQAGLGDRGQIFQMQAGKVLVYWDRSASNTQPIPAPQRPSSVARAQIPCSLYSATHNQRCAVRVERQSAMAGVLYIQRPDGRERVISYRPGENMERFDSIDGSQVRVGHQGDDYYLGLNGDEFYIVPEALLTGG